MTTNAVNQAQLFVTGRLSGQQYEFTLTETTKGQVYTRTYRGTISNDDEVTFPNDLNSRTQTMCVAVAMCLKYPNTYEGDSRPGAASTRRI